MKEVSKLDTLFESLRMKKMVYEINHCSGMVEPEARLSDSVYYYNRGSDRVEIVT